MISDLAVAQEIKRLVFQANERIEESMKLVETQCPSEEFAVYRTAVGKVVAAMLTAIIEPLYERNPSLKPRGWDEF
ncbi:MAG TPA: hypothetical protein VII95_04380 [Terriglobales bacterium]|jgi:hypothetical protein